MQIAGATCRLARVRQSVVTPQKFGTRAPSRQRHLCGVAERSKPEAAKVAGRALLTNLMRRQTGVLYKSPRSLISSHSTAKVALRAVKMIVWRTTLLATFEVFATNFRMRQKAIPAGKHRRPQQRQGQDLDTSAQQ